MLLDNMQEGDLAQLQFALSTNNREGARDTINRIVWRALASVWDREVFGFLFWKKRIRDLRSLWVWAFGEPPAYLGL